MTVLPQHDLVSPVPLMTGEDGVIRVANSRVTLDTIVAAFDEGATAEEIAQQYPSLALADIYAVIGYYLRQREIVTAYLDERKQVSGTVRAENETRFPSTGLRERLLARRNASA